MPLYEYECSQCKYKIEKLAKLTDSFVCSCGIKLSRLISFPTRYNERKVNTVKPIKNINKYHFIPK